MSQYSKQPPYSREAEESLLGAMLIDPSAKHMVLDIVTPGDFFLEASEAVFRAIISVDAPDLMTVADYLENSGELELAGGYSGITGLVNSTPTSVHVESYAKIVKRDAVRRKAIDIATEITLKAFSTTDSNEVVAFTNQAVSKLNLLDTTSGLVPVTDAANDLIKSAAYWREHPIKPGQVRGLTTGFKNWDVMMSGMNPGDFIVVAGRPRMGKTALTLESAYRIARFGYKVVFFALEMTHQALVARLASSISGVEYKRIKRGVKRGSPWHVSQEEYDRFVAAVKEVQSTPHFYIDDTPNLSPEQLRARASKIAMKLGGIDLVVVDTGNLLQVSTVSGENNAQAESRKVRTVRVMTKELETITYMTWQLNRGIESRPVADFGRVPRLADLRDTGGVEEHATDVIGVYRDEVYLQDASLFKGIMHLHGLKRREDEGDTMCAVGYRPETQQFSDQVETVVLDEYD